MKSKSDWLISERHLHWILNRSWGYGGIYMLIISCFFIIYFIHNFIIYFYLNFSLPIPLNLYLWWRHPRQFSVLFLFYLFLHPILRFYQKNKEKKKYNEKHQRVSGWEEVRMITTDICCVHQFTAITQEKKNYGI